MTKETKIKTQKKNKKSPKLGLFYLFYGVASGKCGFTKVLPKKWRFVSIGNAVILILFAWIFLQHAYILESILPFSTHVFVWIIAIFLALNSVANLFSVSKKEKYVMTPLSAAACILCFWIALL
ncbi:TPA: hypothetical protein QC153_005929 [Bacillus cereus]|nr:hypothetical protein [Bacillus wiedmannii]HDR8306444.1 hypothetical protein [Bacillus cereus]HDR7964667.1 hypothetical protein [Bacillus wiedmannii]HDR8482966.1 hypothetical protein [Bacillus cereus]HDR8500034.1 hypothetical protein [Bacillus cereus]